MVSLKACPDANDYSTATSAGLITQDSNVSALSIDNYRNTGRAPQTVQNDTPFIYGVTYDGTNVTSYFNNLERFSLPAGRTIGRLSSPRPLEDHHPGCRTAPRRDGRPLRDRWADERDDLPRIRLVEQCLAPTLGRRDVVIMDNLPAHKVAGVTDAIEAVGATAFYLPPYSPDLNPIEQAFSKLKALLRKAAERTVPKLWRRIRALLRTISDEECLNFFRHAGYASIWAESALASAPATQSDTFGTCTALYIGSTLVSSVRGSGNSSWGGLISEIGMGTVAWSTTDRTSLFNYLRNYGGL
jgi:transposase